MKSTRNLNRKQIIFLLLGSIVLLSVFSYLQFLQSHSKHEEAQVTSKKELWTCSMHPQVIQDHPGTCPICHMTLVPLKSAESVSDSATVPEKKERKIKYWWDPMMNPPYISKTPGKSPMGMDLIPVYDDNASESASLSIDPVIVQNMGVKTAVAKKATLSQEVMAVGYLTEAEPNVHDVNLLISGWIKKLHINAEGMHVEKGQPLFDLYSPEVTVAIQELISSSQAATDSLKAVHKAATKKLELWGLTKEQIESFSKELSPPTIVTIFSPVTGEVISKDVVEGAAVKAGDKVYRIVDLRTLWLTAQVFEKDLPIITIGSKANALVSNKSIQGNVVFIDPRIDTDTRSTKVRLQIPNQDLALKPGMFATVTINSTTPREVTTVPRESVIDTGKRKITFVSFGEGKFALREVVSGLEGSSGLIEIQSGIEPGEEVVTSGQFLLDSESRLREAVQKFLKERQDSSTEDTESHHHHGESAHD